MFNINKIAKFYVSLSRICDIWILSNFLLVICLLAQILKSLSVTDLILALNEIDSSDTIAAFKK